MNRLFKYKNFMLTCIYFLMVFSLVHLVALTIVFDLSFSRQIILAIIVTMFVKFFIQNRVIFYLSLFIIMIGAFVVTNTTIISYPFLERSKMLFDNLYEHIFMNKAILEENKLLFWILFMAFYSIFTSLIIFRLKRGLWFLILIYLPLFIYYWYYGTNNTYIFLAIFLFSYLVLYGQAKFNKEKRKISKTQKQYFSKLDPFWLKTTLIYSILIVIIAFVLPKSNSSIRWIWMEDQIKSTFPGIENINIGNRGSSDQASRFDFAATGFQENPSRLGGPISPGNNIIMKVYADDPVYLRGAVRHHYDGNMWSVIETEGFELYQDSSNSDDIIRYDIESYYDEIREIRVQFKNYSSTTLFTPLLLKNIQVEGKNEITMNRDGIIEINEGIYGGEAYSITALVEPFNHIPIDYEMNYSDEILDYFEDYLQVPMDRITQRTIDLKDEIIAGIEGNYEKALAFESYLKNNYDYTQNTSPVPEGYEFIDYFLFEEEAGYCTYFATAMTMFLRMEGIPSRYVEGYVAYETSEEEGYDVKQSHAHAWVEVLNETVGWATFDPTPSNSLDDEDIEEELENENEETLPEEEESEKDEEKNLQERDSVIEDSQESENNLETEGETSENSISLHFIIGIMIGLLFLLIILLAYIRILRYRKKEEQMNRLSNDKKMIFLYEKLLQLTESLGYPKDLSETLYEYSNRISHKFPPLEEITDIFVRNKYGDMIPSDDEIQKLADYCEELEEQLKKSLGRIEYYIHKYK